jgi:hypothetical protein
LRNSAKVLAMAFRPLPRCEPWGRGAGCFVLLVWCFSLSAPCTKHGASVPSAECGGFASGPKHCRSVTDGGRGILACRTRRHAALTMGTWSVGATGGFPVHRAKCHAVLTMGTWPVGATGGILAHRTRHRATATYTECSPHAACIRRTKCHANATCAGRGRIAAFARGGG